MDRIEFYRERDTYGEFSNFAPFPVEIDGKCWPTTEHYFQAQKFQGTDHEEAIRLAASPSIAAKMGQIVDFRFARTGNRSRTRSCTARSWPSSPSMPS